MFVRCDGDHLLECVSTFTLFHCRAVDCVNEVDLRIWESLVADGLAFDEVALFEAKAFNQFACNKWIGRPSFAIAGRVEELASFIREYFQNA